MTAPKGVHTVSGEVRWVERYEGTELKKILQQRWHSAGGYKWIDVPTEVEEKENG